mmetsp:Transcript_26318/g.62507  ORF Transcript_26318/g.62507 Transcript_26318/m.62507 type:complete len:641 (-) Transcript_26318:108-2030(-)
MALAHARRGDLDEFGLVLHVGDGGAAAVVHGRLQATGHLEDHLHDRALVGHLALDALGHQLGRVGVVARLGLEVAVGAALGHRAHRAHAAVALEGAALVEDGFARGFFGAGEGAAHHHAVGAGRDGLGQVTGVAHAAVGDDRHASALERRSDVVDRGDLRHAHAGDDARGADRTRADADLDAVRTGFHQRQRRSAGGDIAADDIDLRVGALDPAHPVQHAGAVAVGGVDDDGIDAGTHQQLDALLGVFAEADRRADAQAAMGVTRRIGEAGLLGDVLHRHQAAQLEGVVDDDHTLQLVGVHQGLGLVQRSALLDRDELFGRRHDFADLGVHARLEAQVPPGDDADHPPALDHREAREAMQPGQLDHLAHRGVRADRQRLADDAALVALDPGHLARLGFRRQVLVHDADAALLRNGDREAGLGHGVHRGGHQRQVQGDVARQTGRKAGVTWQHLGERWHQQNIVEGERFAEKAHEESSRRKAALYGGSQTRPRLRATEALNCLHALQTLAHRHRGPAAGGLCPGPVEVARCQGQCAVQRHATAARHPREGHPAASAGGRTARCRGGSRRPAGERARGQARRQRAHQGRAGRCGTPKAGPGRPGRPAERGRAPRRRTAPRELRACSVGSARTAERHAHHPHQ